MNDKGLVKTRAWRRMFNWKRHTLRKQDGCFSTSVEDFPARMWVQTSQALFGARLT